MKIKIPILIPSSVDKNANSLTLKAAIAIVIVLALEYSGIPADISEVTELVNSVLIIASYIVFVYGGVRRIIFNYRA